MLSEQNSEIPVVDLQICLAEHLVFAPFDMTDYYLYFEIVEIGLARYGQFKYFPPNILEKIISKRINKVTECIEYIFKNI